MATLDDYMKRITGKDNKKKEEEQKLRFNKTSDTSIQKRLKDYASVVGKAYDDEQKYISSLSPVDQSAYKRVKASNYVYSSPYLKKGREGKSDLEYGDTSWNQLSKEEKERWFDTVEKNPNANYNDKDIPWQARYAYDIMNASQTTKVGAFGANKKKMFDLQTEQKWMWNSLPAKVRNGIRTGDKEAMDYLKKNYSSDEISMFQKYAELMSDVEDVESIKEMQSDLMESNPVYAVGIAPIQQIGADIGAAMFSAPRTLWNLASERGNYDVVNPYDSFLQKAAEAGRGVQQEILEGLDDRKLMQAYYGASVSTAESALRLGLAHGAATVLTKIPALSSLPYDKVAGIAMNGLMFPSVVQQSAVEMQQKGVPASQALAKAISAGIFECLFETISFDKLGFFNETPVVGSVKTFAKNLLKSGFVEGSEEVATDIANEIYDNFAMYDYSDFKAFKDKLEADSGEPISDKEAWKLYGSEFADKLTESFIGGAFSGMTMGGTTNARGIANYRAYESMGANVNDATAARMTPVINDLMSNPNIAARMELVSDSETARRGMMQEIFNNMERMYGSRIEKATEKSLPVIMQNINTSLNGVISEDLINKYNAKMIEFGKGDEQVDYAKYRQNMEKGNQTTFDDMAYGEGDASVLQEYEKANKEYRDAMFDGSLDAQYRVEAMNKAEEQMEQSRQAAIEIVENAAARGESLDSPALRKYVSVLGIEDSAMAYSAAKVVGENVSVKAKKGSVSSISREEASAVFGDNAGDIEEVTYQNIEHNPDFKEGLYFGQIVAKMTGADVKLYKSTRKNIQNGAYRNGTIYIDVNAGHSGEAAALGEVFSHELTHWMRDNNEAGYQNLLDFVRSNAGETFDNLVKNKMDQMKRIAEKTGNTSLELDENAAQEEVIAEACQKMLYSSETFMEYAKADLQGAKNFVERFIDFLKRLRNAFKGSLHSDPTDVIGKLEGLAQEWEKVLNDAINAEVALDAGIDMESMEDTVLRNAIRDTLAAKDQKEGKKDGYWEAKVSSMLQEKLGVDKATADKYIQDEQSIASLIYDNLGFLDYKPDDRYEAIKKNSDYPQGTVDLTNLCRKRAIFTQIFDSLQKAFPGRLFDAMDIAEIRQVLKDHEYEVACALCFVEDRRQRVGEIAENFIERLKLANGGALTVVNSSGETKVLYMTKDLANQDVSKRAGFKYKDVIKVTDKYIPNQYDLVTYDGFRELSEKHPQVAAAFIRANNYLGMSSARLVEGRAEYKREILKYTPAQVKRINNKGGLRIFSFSDFEAVHLLDICQVITDASAVGLKIQAYTKVPEFAKLVANTGIKLNRSLIPYGVKGYEVLADGTKRLKYDPVEGININHPDFFDATDNPNIGNILVGINDEQIRLAMLDDFVNYIIPFHTNQGRKVLAVKGISAWTNYKEYQRERYIDGRKGARDVNIYTQVIDKYNPVNKVEFVNAFLKECKSQGKIPRFDQFLNKDANGNYVYTPGYEKLLLDFKLFDKYGYILPQTTVNPSIDMTVAKKILADEIKNAESRGQVSKEIIKELEKKYKARYSFRGESSTMSKADQKNLAVAREMDEQNYDSEKIRLATGWFKGMDGKWRNEVDDSGAKFKVNFISNSMFGTNEVRDAFTDAYEQARRDADSKLQALNAMARKGVTGNMQEYKDANAAWVEASKTADELDRVRLRADHGYVYLSDILDHPKLFKAYPQLKNMRVSWFQTDNGLRGVNYGGVNGISVAINRESAEDVMSTLMHEVQHEIQNIEGFSKGASPSYWAEVETPETKTIADLNRKMEKLTEELSAIELGEDAWYGQNAFELASMYAFLNKRLNDNALNPKAAEHAREDIPEIIATAEKYSLMDKFNEYAKLSEEISKAKEDAKANKGEPFDLYQRTAGEIESRDVQARLNMSAKERKATRPDIDREDVVFAKYSPREMNSRLTEDDMSDYLNAGNRQNKKKHEKNALGKTIMLTSEEQIHDYIEGAISGNIEDDIVAYGKVGKRLERDVLNYSNGQISVSGDYLELPSDDLKHAYSKHAEALGDGDIALTEEDFLNIPDYFDTYDEFLYVIKHKSGDTKLCVAKEIGRGKMIVIETVSKSRGAVQFKTAFGVTEEKYKNYYLARYKKDHSNSGGSKSSTFSLRDDMVSTQNISQSETDVKRFSTRDSRSIEEINADYMKAYESGDEKLMGRYVEEAARRAGYNSPKVFHGTRFFGWTRYKDDSHDTPFIYTSTDSSVSANYAGDNHYAGIRKIGKAFKYSNDINDIIQNAESVYDTKYHIATNKERQTVYDEVVKEASEIADKLNTFDATFDFDDELANAMARIESAFWTVQSFNDEWGNKWNDNRQTKLDLLKSDLRSHEEDREKLRNWYGEHRNELSAEQKKLMSYLLSYEVGDTLIDMEYSLEKALYDGQIIASDVRGMYSAVSVNFAIPSEIQDAMEQIHNIGSYQLYGDIGDNPLEFDANGSQFWALKVPQMGDDEYHGTDAVSKWALENGYTSVIMHNIYDYGNKADNYVFFSSNQLKSADPVTYDDNGNVIPLTERFNKENEDIRYSYRDLANSESEILINALKNDAALVDEFGARPSIEAYAREYNRLKEMENQQIEITKQLRKKDTSPSEREALLKKMVRLDRAILNKTTELTEMRNQRVIRDLLISEWDKRDTLVAAGRAEERYLTRKALEEKYGKELSALKEKTRQQKQEIRDRHTINERKARIIKKTKQLMDMCLHPTEKKKVPTVLINPVVELLDAIDYWTPAEGRRVTKKSESLRERFVNFREAINEYQEQINEGTEQIEYMFDPEFLETVDELAKSVKGINNVNDMNAEEITALDQTLTQLYHLISRGNKMITASHYQTVNEYTDKTRQAMEKRKTLSEKTSAKGSWLSRLNAGMSDTYAFGEYAGEGTREIVDMLSKAFEDKEFHVKEAIEFTQEVLKPYKNELKKWSQEEHEFTLSTTDKDGNPNKVKLTVGQMMELYLLNKREQARGHIYGGGIRVENRKGKFTESVKITESDVAEIMDYLKSVPGAMEVADKLQQYGATTITGWGNQASNLMYGISKFTDENYWQIRSDSSALKDNENTEKALNASMYRLQNMGRTKAVKKGANNAIYIGDVFDTWSKTIDEMTSYASILPATTDAMRWWNSRVELDGENTVRVKKLLESKLGTDMTRVFTDTIKALNGGIMGTDSLESLVKKLTGKAKAAAVAGNLRVVLQQPTAYTRAAAVIEPKYLLKALTMKPNAKEAQEHSAIAWHKAQGFYSNGLAPSLRKMVIGDASIGENLTEKSLWLAGKADDITWGALWNASKLKVEAENKALKVGSDAYWNEVNKVFSNIINQTQVVDTPLTKSTWMRGNGLGVYFTAFMAEPTKTYSMVMERLDRVLQNPTSKDAWKAFAGVGAVFAVNAMVNAMAQALADAARDDDKDKDYWEKYIEQYNKDVKDNINPITYIPVVKDIWSLSQGYSNSNLSMQAAQNTVYAVNELKKIANGTSKKTLFGQAETVAKAISGWTGIPVGNVMRTLNSIGNVAGVDIFRRKKYTNSELGRNVVLSMNEGDTSAADAYMAELLENCKGDTNKANNYVITYLADHDNEIDAWAEKYMEDATTINDAIDAMSDKYSAEIVTKAIRKSVNNDADEDDKIKTSTLAESQYTSDDINRMLENGKITEAQDIIDEVNAKYKEMGSKTTAKNAVTAYWKPKYLAASGAERDKILKMLYKLKNNGQQMYSSKDIAKWK